MWLRSVHLRNFRCFEDARLDFTSEGQVLTSIVVAGANGAGKSSILDAIAGFFTALERAYEGPDFAVSDVRAGAARAEVETAWEERGTERFAAPVWIVASDTDLRPGVFGPSDLALQGRVVHDPSIPRWSRQLEAVEPSDRGLIVGFDAHRALPTVAVAGPNVSSVPKSRLDRALARRTTDRRSEREGGRFADLKQWIVNLDFVRVRAIAAGKPAPALWGHLVVALNQLFEPFVFREVTDDFDILFRGPTGTIPLSALSDGYQSLFIVITELLLRCSLAAPADQVLDAEGVCLVDEIDAHLHPRLQARALPALRELFPRIQFIVTTHSPFIVASVEPENVFRLDHEV